MSEYTKYINLEGMSKNKRVGFLKDHIIVMSARIDNMKIEHEQEISDLKNRLEDLEVRVRARCYP